MIIGELCIMYTIGLPWILQQVQYRPMLPRCQGHCAWTMMEAVVKNTVTVVVVVMRRVRQVHLRGTVTVSAKDYEMKWLSLSARSTSNLVGSWGLDLGSALTVSASACVLMMIGCWLLLLLGLAWLSNGTSLSLRCPTLLSTLEVGCIRAGCGADMADG